MYVQSDEDTFLKVDEVSKTEAQPFDIFDQLISRFKFCVWIVSFYYVFDVLLVSKKSPKDRLKVMIDLAYILLYEFKKLIHSFFLKVKKQKQKQKLIEVIIIGEFFWELQYLLNDFMWC